MTFQSIWFLVTTLAGLGIPTLAAAAAPVAKPNIDRIARSGILFRNCFANNSICTPSRAAILTGKYSHKNGVTVFNRFDGTQPHLAKYLQQAGYQTAMVGKWHLFSEPTGFDYWRTCVRTGVSWTRRALNAGRGSE